MSNFREKYLKYKSKYFELKNLVGGSLNITIRDYGGNEEALNNINITDTVLALKNNVHQKYNNDDYLPVNQIMKLQCDGSQSIILEDNCKLESHGITNGSKIILEKNELNKFIKSLYSNHFDYNTRGKEIINKCTSKYTENYYLKTITKHPTLDICYRSIEKYNIGIIKNILNTHSKNFSNILNFVEIPNYFTRTDNVNNNNAYTQNRCSCILDDNFILLGRLNYKINNNNLFLSRDRNYYNNFEKILNKLGNLDNILFFDFTGHSSSFIIKLLEKGIDIKLQMSSNDVSEFTTVLNQFQDMLPQIMNKNITNTKSLGISLIAPHTLTLIYDISKLPTKEEIQKCGFTKIVVTVEGRFNLEPLKDDTIIQHRIYQDITDPETKKPLEIIQKFSEMKSKPNGKPFFDYINGLAIDTQFYGLNEIETRELKDNFEC